MYSRHSRRIAFVLFVAIIMTAGLGSTALASVAAKINSNTKVYQYASTKAASINVPKGLAVSITGIANGWAQVSYKGNTAYMPLSQLTPTNKVAGYATGSTAVYNASLKQMCTISKGTSVYVLGTIGNYYLVMNSSGALGYIKNGALSQTKPVTTTAAPATSKVSKALSMAQSLLGKPYNSSSNPPSSFDCSSFVWYCMGMAGISVYKTAATQAADGRYQKITSVNSLKAGDMIFFDTSGNGAVDHSAIYIGDGKFVEASRNAGKVQINTMTSWYKSHFKWARRP